MSIWAQIPSSAPPPPAAAASTALAAAAPKAMPGPRPAKRLSLDQAIQLALTHSPALAAAREQIPQSLADEVTASLRPNPVLSWDILYLPIFSPGQLNLDYLNNTAEYDASFSYTLERGHKRQARMRAARDVTAVVRSQVADTARTLSYNVSQQFVNVLLAQSNLAFAQQDLASWRNTVQIGQSQYSAGAVSGGDFDTLRLQTLQFQTAVSSSRLNLAQSLSTLRQQIGFSGVPVNYGVIGSLSYQPVHGNLDDMKNLALHDRPDLIAAQRAVTAAASQHRLAQADGKRDLTLSFQYSHTGAINTGGGLFSIEIPIFDRNQGEIARTVSATVQAQDTLRQVTEQVLTDVTTAFEAVRQDSQIVKLYTSGYRRQAQEVLAIRRYSYRRGATTLLDLLDAERTYRSTELGYRQALANYMLALEQLKEAVGTRTLP